MHHVSGTVLGTEDTVRETKIPAFAKLTSEHKKPLINKIIEVVLEAVGQEGVTEKVEAYFIFLFFSFCF